MPGVEHIFLKDKRVTTFKMGDLQPMGNGGALLNGQRIYARTRNKLIGQLPKPATYSIEANLGVEALLLGQALQDYGCVVTYYVLTNNGKKPFVFKME